MWGKETSDFRYQICLPLLLVQDGLELLPRPLLVLRLRALLLALHHGAGREVGQPHRAVRRVDALAARAARPHELPLEVSVLELDGDVAGLGQHGHAAGAGLQPVGLGAGDGNSLHAVHPALELEQPEHLAAGLLAQDPHHALSTRNVAT